MNVFIYSCLSYPACKAQIFFLHSIKLLCVACLAAPYSSTFFHKQRVSEKFHEHKMCVLISATTFVRHIYNSKYSARYYHERILVFMSSTCYSCQILIKLESSR
jgi:integral membrane sensor domain MASE1